MPKKTYNNNKTATAITIYSKYLQPYYYIMRDCMLV